MTHPLNYFKIKKMKVTKKIIKESLGFENKWKKTFSEKKQNIIITEKQLERLIEIFQREK